MINIANISVKQGKSGPLTQDIRWTNEYWNCRVTAYIILDNISG